MVKVIKRSGEEKPFDARKVRNAIRRANAESGENAPLTDEQMDRITAAVSESLEKSGERQTSECIQDEVERQLMAMGAYGVAKCYVLYRKRREHALKTIRIRDGKPAGKADLTDQSLLLVSSATQNSLAVWDRSKIAERLTESLSLSEEEADAVAKDVEGQVVASGLTTITSTLIRELVNNALLDRGYKGKLEDLKMYKVPCDFIDGLMHAKSNENSNIVSNNPEAVNLAIAELVLKQWGLDRIFSPEVKHAHDTGAIHLHDLGYPHRVYCSSHSLEYIKKYGLKGLNNLNTTSLPARSASVLTGHLNTFLASMQANYAGALGIAFINVLYAPLLAGMTDREIHQVAQELIFNGSQNAFSRGGQTLFLDFNIHTGVPSHLKKTPAIGAGGKYLFRTADGETVPLEENTNPFDGEWQLLYRTPAENAEVVLRERDGKQEFPESAYGRVLTYGDYEDEARRFTSQLLKVWKDGDAYGHVFEFPKCDFHVSAETFTDPKQYELFQEACDLASHNGSTYFVFDRDEVTLSACCRLRTTIEDKSVLLHPEHLRFSFPRNEIITIRQGGKIRSLSFGRLFDETETAPICEDGYEIKELEGTEIWDENGWTGLRRILRHKKKGVASSTLLGTRLNNGTLVCTTANHPMIACGTNKPASCPKCGSPCLEKNGTSQNGKYVIHCLECGKYTVAEPFKANDDRMLLYAAELTQLHSLVPCKEVPLSQSVSLDGDLAYLLGAYIGDGCGAGTSNCCICKPKDSQLIERVSAILERCLGKRPGYYTDRIIFSDKTLPMLRTVGANAYEKQLPEDFLEWTSQTFGDVVSGLIDTDGCIHGDVIEIVSVGKALVTQIQQYLRGIGIRSVIRLHSRCNAQTYIHPETGERNSCHPAYLLEIGMDSAARFLFAASDKVKECKAVFSGERTLPDDGIVRDIVPFHDGKEEFVYDVTTDTHTFVSNGVLLHNCGFQNVTINIPQCAYRASRLGDKSLTGLLKELDGMMALAVQAHLQKKAVISKLMERPGDPLWQVGKIANDGRPYIELDKCTYIIGVIGVNDAVKFLTGKEMHESDEAFDMALAIAAHMFENAKRFTKETGLKFNIEESPAESAARRLAKADLLYFREEALQVYKGGGEDVAYYTNSVHLSADAPVSLVERIRKQSMFHSAIESGAIIHAFIGEQTPSPEAIGEVVRRTFLDTQAAQLTFSPEFTYCQDCGGRQRGLKDVCPQCGSKNVVGETRVVGYFSKISNFNLSKVAELHAREHGDYAVDSAEDFENAEEVLDNAR